MNQIATTQHGHITIRKTTGTWVVRADGAVIAESGAALDVAEGDQPSVIYFPRKDVAMAFLDPSETSTTCQDRGTASYFSIVTQDKTLPDGAWSYEAPPAGMERLAGHMAFHATDMVAVEQL